MPTLRIEHPITDYDTWRAAFDRDPVDRRGSGVRRYAIHRPVDDPRYVLIDLDFDTAIEAERMLARLTDLWRSSVAAPALDGAPQTRVIETTEVVDL
ncbi:MAG TPA: hypothetical protein VF314_00520 [Actinomycetes bacterium]